MNTTKRAITLIAPVAALALLATVAPADAAGPPLPADDNVSVAEGSGPVSVSVLDNDVDPDGDPLVVSAVTDGTTDGVTVTWDPAGFVGDKVIGYTVTAGGESADATLTITVTAAPGVAPTVVDDIATVTTGGVVVVPVLDNDSDDDGDALTVTGIVGAPSHGSATTNGSNIRYKSQSPFVGQDSLTYEASDGTYSSEGQVDITVTASPNQAPVAKGDLASTRWHHTIRIPVLANDNDDDGDRLRVTRVGKALNGRVTLSSKSVTYQPRGEFTGVDQFTYTVGDGRGAKDTATVRVRVRPAYEVSLKRPNKAVALRRTEVTGRVTTRAGGRVDIRIQRAVGQGRWRTIGETRVRVDKKFQRQWLPKQPGRDRLRAIASWENGKRDVSPVFRLRVKAKFDPVVSNVTANDVPKSWRPGCPVGPGSLRMIEMNYFNYDKKLKRGTLIGASWAVSDYLYVFKRAFATKFLIKRMHPVDRYGGVDERAMRAGNTSAFNCRHVTGSPYRMSRHSWGDAIDINTFENPYVTGSRVYPAAAAWQYYVNRSKNLKDPGVITSRSSIARALFDRGWHWGARWSNPDYQHWSDTGA